MAIKPGTGPGGASAPRRPPFDKWSRIFLAHLAATSNVSASAKVAGVTTFVAYDARRASPEFNRAWHRALCEGYDHLEMELLQRLREGEIRPARDAKRGVRTFDNATAFRQLGVHREAVAHERALRDNEDENAILASIDAKLARMRERWLAEQAAVAHEGPDQGPAADDDPA